MVQDTTESDYEYIMTRHGLLLSTVVTRSQSVVFVFLKIFQCQLKIHGSCSLPNLESVCNNMLSNNDSYRQVCQMKYLLSKLDQRIVRTWYNERWKKNVTADTISPHVVVESDFSWIGEKGGSWGEQTQTKISKSPECLQHNKKLGEDSEWVLHWSLRDRRPHSECPQGVDIYKQHLRLCQQNRAFGGRSWTCWNIRQVQFVCLLCIILMSSSSYQDTTSSAMHELYQGWTLW